MENIEAVLFDFDGTIIDNDNEQIESWKYAFRKLNSEFSDLNLDQYLTMIERDSISFLESQKGITTKAAILDNFPVLFPNSNLLKRISEERKKSNKKTDYSKIINEEDFKKIIEECNRKSYTVGIVTSAPKESLKKAFKVNPFLKNFIKNNIFCKGMGTYEEEKKDGIANACESLKINPNQTIYYGDALADVDAARRIQLIPALLDRNNFYGKRHIMYRFKNHGEFLKALETNRFKYK